jgi:isoleucyl-tRNA synthetase
MSKSLGNGVDPNKVVNVQGADILRLWVASIDYQADCKIGDEILKQVSETYRKIRNTCRFLVGNLSNGDFSKFDVNKDAVDSYEFVDLCILEKLQDVTNKYLDCFDAYDFAGAVSEMLNFMTIDLSSFYLDLSKDILYCETYESLRRKQVQNVLYTVLDTVVRLLTPIIPHTMDELYESMGGSKFSSVLLDMPTRREVDTELLAEYKNLLTLRSDVLKAIEVKRGEGTIKSSQEVALTLEVVDENVKKTFDKLMEERYSPTPIFTPSMPSMSTAPQLPSINFPKFTLPYIPDQLSRSQWMKGLGL